MVTQMTVLQDALNIIVLNTELKRVKMSRTNKRHLIQNNPKTTK